MGERAPTKVGRPNLDGAKASAANPVYETAAWSHLSWGSLNGREWAKANGHPNLLGLKNHF
jgi:hypothetical protein